MNTFLRVLSIAGAVSAITACGSSGGGGGKPDRKVGPITANNYQIYARLAIATLPSTEYGLPVGDLDYNPFEAREIDSEIATESIEEAPCDNSEGKVLIILNETNEDEPQSAEGDYQRAEYSNCIWEEIKQEGSIENSIGIVTTFTPPDNLNELPSNFTLNTKTSSLSYEGYRITDINSSDFLELDGTFEILNRTDSVPAFNDTADRHLETVPDRTTAKSVTIEGSISDKRISQEFTDFAYSITPSEIQWSGTVSTLLDGKVYSYTVDMQNPLNRSLTDESITGGEVIITAGISKLLLTFNSNSNQVLAELDVENDGEIDHNGIVVLD